MNDSHIQQIVLDPKVTIYNIKYFASSSFENLNSKVIIPLVVFFFISTNIIETTKISRSHRETAKYASSAFKNNPNNSTGSSILLNGKRKDEKSGGDIKKFNNNKLSKIIHLNKRSKNVKIHKSNNLLPATLKENDILKNEFDADLIEGTIGVVNIGGVDAPQDNYFSVNINQSIVDENDYYLQYEVFGIEGLESVTRSINERVSRGGYFIKFSNNWNKLEEPLSSQWLQSGVNSIKFGTIDDSYSYKIRNVKIVKKLKSNNVEKLVLYSNQVNFQSNDKIYIRGYCSSINEKVVINSNEWNTSEGEFEFICTLTNEDKERGYLMVECSDSSMERDPIIL